MPGPEPRGLIQSLPSGTFRVPTNGQRPARIQTLAGRCDPYLQCVEKDYDPSGLMSGSPSIVLLTLS